MKRDSSPFGLYWFKRWVEICYFSVVRYFPTLVNNSLNSLKILSDKEGKFLYSLTSRGWLTMQTGWRNFLCVTSIPSLGRLSFPRMFRSCPPVMRNGVSLLIHPLDCVLTIIFPNCHRRSVRTRSKHLLHHTILGSPSTSFPGDVCTILGIYIIIHYSFYSGSLITGFT